ncbi:GTPBP1 family GTP-binding protein [Methanocella arvoryzae]|uniref:Conserved GTP-binding protein n=1 Tax=Methanocella arvoryzae (strain DSM 22066 / NBRC 105507 / MRE50) TaxID=351160 RepID=Q0W1G3_METAR|nr:GTP-binding protein [Methanocella arvoryzae]CAJ37780.1 conserved GTP-binding protein [Methanocella arvoryzae MRE50]
MNKLELEALISAGETDNIEFKEFLNRETHLNSRRMETLACQMKHRVIAGNGSAVYVIGVTDAGNMKGITREEFEETVLVLDSIAAEIEARVTGREEYQVNGGLVGLITIESTPKSSEHILIGTAGHVDHGKSTLVGALVTGRSDDGAGRTRIFLDVLPHEISRGLSADLSYAVYGIKGDSVIHLNNPLNKKESANVVAESDKIISFVDTVGHEPWLRTTIRGIVGQKLDYGLLVVAADDGVTHITREHLGILLAMDLPVIIALTKVDVATPEQIKKTEASIHNALKLVGRVPFRVKTPDDVFIVSDKAPEGIVVPILHTSSVTREGYDLLEQLIFSLPKRNLLSKEPFQMYIDRIYQVEGVGVVVSGTIKQGEVVPNDILFLGPTKEGAFVKVKVQSIEMHHYRVNKGVAGDIVGVAIKGIKPHEVVRGMMLSKNMPEAAREFDAEILILNHPTRIGIGYEPVIHLETICEAIEVVGLDAGYMMAGQHGKARMRFKFRPYVVEPGQKFIFREGKSKGVGRVL